MRQQIPISFLCFQNSNRCFAYPRAQALKAPSLSSLRLTVLTRGHSEKAHQDMAIESGSPRKKCTTVAGGFWYSDQQ